MIPIAAEIAFIGFWAAVGVWCGLILFNKLDRIARRRGVIGLYV